MISIIIPALNEELALPGTLRSLQAQAGDCEILVVDGGSTDSTLTIAGQFPQVTLISAPPGRATQMNAGAAATHGDLILFLHADTQLPEGAICKLVALAKNKGPLWGGYHQRFSGDTLALRIISAIHNWRCRRTGIFYGDQAMFVERALFELIGGFPEDGELEDIRLSERLLQETKPSFLAATVVTDSRKFEQMGPARSFLRCLMILACYELRLPLKGQAFFAPIR